MTDLVGTYFERAGQAHMSGSNLSARDAPVIIRAPTGRGKCQTSQEPIAQGELKVVVHRHVSGRA